MNRIFSLSLIVLLTCFLSFNSFAQNGWKQIENNDFVAAKTSFEKALKTDANNKDALYGLIFLSEVMEDDDQYEKYVTQLVKSRWDEQEFLLFGHVIDAEAPEILEQKLSNRAKAGAYFSIADSLFHNRRKKDAFKVLNDFVGDYDWSIIGPFKNVAGSGHIAKLAVETDKFDTEKVYTNNTGAEISWLNRTLRYPDGRVDFALLPSVDYGKSAVYYANTFLEIPSDRTVQLRIARRSPMKIWIDDNLVFDNNENIERNWDAEFVELDLKKGTHRVLVKLSEFPEGFDRATLSLYYRESGYNSNPSFGGYGNNYSDEFAIRITDKDGKLYSDINSKFNGKYTKATFQPKVTDRTVINHFENQLKQNPTNWANYYLLCKAFMKFDNSEDGEEMFAEYLKSHENNVYFNYLMAKFYTSNGKSERGEKLISNLDKTKTPIFKILFKEFQKLDEEDDEEEYLAALYELLTVSPSNSEIVLDIINYYAKKGKLEEKRKFITDFLKDFPKYTEDLEEYLKDDSYVPSSYKPVTDKEKEANYKKSLKRLKDEYSAYDYNTVIGYLKNQEKEKVDKIVDYYDDIIKMEPYRLYYIKQKGAYLFEKEKLDAALKVFNRVLQISPYDSEAYETIGDIYHEKKDKKTALEYYKKAEKIGTGGYNYGNSLEEKISKIEEPEKFDDLFSTPTFEEAMKDESWKEKYKNEESVILLHTLEAQVGKQNVIEIDQKVLIKIQTKAGAKFWTEANFGMFGRINYVRIIKPDGREVTPERSGAYVVFKDLDAGDLIQLEGEYSSEMSAELDNELFFTLPLNHEAIIHKSKAELLIDEGSYLQFLCNRIDCNYKKRTERGKDIYTWENDDIAKVEAEDAVLDGYDMYAWVMMSSLKDWSAVSDWYLDKTYRRLEPNYEVQAITDSIVSPEMTEKEKIVTIYNYITKEINYSFVSFLQSNFIPKRPGATCSAKIGDCKDVASLMISMLRHVGIESYYVLVKTRNFISAEPVPSLWFDHVIVGYMFEGKMHYMDLTTDFYPYYVVHEGDSDAWALLIKEGSNKVFNLPNDHLDPNKSLFNVEVNAKFGLDRTVDLTVNTNSKGVVGGYMRERLDGMTEEERRKFISQYFGESVFENLKILDYDFGEVKGITAPLDSKFEFKSEKFLDKISRFYVFEIPYMRTVTRMTELLPEKRYNNLDLHQVMDIYPNIQVVNIEMPEGYRLSEVPKSMTMNNDFFDYEVRYESTPKGMKVYRELKFKDRLVKAEDYAKFKELYLQLVEADSLKLAMEK